LPDEAEEESKTKGTRPSENQIKRGFRAHSSRFGANVEAQPAALCLTFRFVDIFAFIAAELLATGRAAIHERFLHLPRKITRRSKNRCTSTRNDGMSDDVWQDRARDEREQ
jgi:hypothetical protein